MTDSQKLSRRDWFRLRLRKPLADAATDAAPMDVSRAAQREPSMGQTTVGLQDIPHPENHDGLDLSELPPMREAMLSSDQVAQLFADIEALGTDIVLMQRSTRTARATGSAANSSENVRTARTSLLSGSITRLQIRYRWQDKSWIDTLETTADGYRLIRIAHQNG